jgi:hypothetical protein
VPLVAFGHACRMGLEGIVAKSEIGRIGQDGARIGSM